jgi:hypothetical protein
LDPAPPRPSEWGGWSAAAERGRRTLPPPPLDPDPTSPAGGAADHVNPNGRYPPRPPLL